LSNQTFSSLSHSFGENQSEEKPTTSDDEGDQEADDLAIPSKYNKLIVSLRTAFD
jgi:hypothetical protein